MPSPQPAFDLDALRARVPLTQTRVLMNACSRGAQTLAARAAADAYLESWGRDGMDWEAWVAEVEAARAAFGAVVSAHAADVAVSTSLSAVASSVASALDFPEERPIIVSSVAEFPTVAHVWLAQERRGARVHQIEAPAGT
ncbi:MAG: aminotransferase, partial [Myxococcota bacterium]